MPEWTKNDDQRLQEIYPNLGVRKSAERMNRTPRAIAGRAHRLGLKMDRQGEHWRDYQVRAAKTKVGRKRPDQALVMRKLWNDGKLGVYTEQRRDEISKAMKLRWQRQGHPRGMKGKRHTATVIEIISETSRKAWADPNHVFNSSRYRQRLSDSSANYQASRTNRETDYSRCKRGKREDLNGLFVRSRWEANYARYLNWLKEQGKIFSWVYEEDRFVFEAEKMGVRSYTPDFKVKKTATSAPYYVEVKGWMDDRSKERLRLMMVHFPTVDLVLVGATEYAALERKFSKILPKWEIQNGKN